MKSEVAKLKKLTNKAKSSDNRYSGTILLKCKIDAWDKNFQKYDEESWMTSITEKINTGLTVTQEVCDNVITPLVEKQLNGLNKEYENN